MRRVRCAILKEEHTSEHSVDRDVDARRALDRGARLERTERGGAYRIRNHEGELPDRDAPAVHGARDAGPHPFAHIRREAQFDAPVARLAENCRRERMYRYLFDGRGVPDHVVGRHAGERLDRDDLWSSRGDRAGLVE